MSAQDIEYQRLKEVCTQCGKSFAAGTIYCPTDGNELMQTIADPLIGMVLPRRYRILSLLGRGSMSVVYTGTYEPLDQLVAVKMLKSHLVSDPHQLKRFQQEIKTAGSLNHPNIVGILDFGVTDQGVPYLIMEHLNGRSVAEVIEKDGRISVHRAVRMFSQAADALAYAHREGVIHRDIKPSNLIVLDDDDETDIVKVVDFGIAKLQNSGSSASGGAAGLTATNEVLGTPLYMSPEQSQGRELDGRSDIYSLGCVLYHALTGKPPFMGDTPIDTIRMQVSAAAIPIEVVRPDLFFPERLQEVINKALAKDPRNRYQRMEHFKADLENCDRRSEVPSTSIRAQRVEEEPPVVLDDKPEFTLSLPALCVVLGIVFTVGVIGWAVLTDVGKKTDVKVSLPVGDETAWKDSLAAGQKDFTQGHYADAEKNFQEALDAAKKFKQPDSRVAVTLNDLASVYDADDRLADAEESSKKALDILKQTNDNSVELADTLTNLCRIESALSHDDQAEQYGKQALDLRQKSATGNNEDLALTLQALAQLDCKKGDYEHAADLLSKALTNAVQSAGGESPNVASICNDLGMVREKQHEYTEADELFNRALGIRQKQLGTGHPAVADSLCALGTLKFNTKQDQAAENLFNQALAIRQKSFGEDNSRTAEVYSCLAILYDNEHKFEKAEDCYRKALQIREGLWGSSSPRLVRSLEHLAKFLREHGQTQGAEVYELQIKRISNT